MREVLFRAKTIEFEQWIKGSLIKIKNPRYKYINQKEDTARYKIKPIFDLYGSPTYNRGIFRN